MIALDKFRNYAMEFNTKGMYRGVKDSKGNLKFPYLKVINICLSMRLFHCQLVWRLKIEGLQTSYSPIQSGG